MKHAALVLLLAGAACAGLQEKDSPLRILIRAGPKTHGPGEHDHPRFLAEWQDLLRSRGAEVAGSMQFPTAEQLAKADVLVLYAAEGGTIASDERERLKAFLRRGGGIVAIHDSVCGKDPQWFKTVVGGAWEHGKSKFHHGTVGIYLQDYDHPVTKGAANFFIDDEIYWDLHLMPEARVLASGFRTAHEITPQMWVYEKDAYRAFVSLQGHKHASFSLPHYRALLLRGIAWAGKRDADLLVTKEERASLRYPEGGPTAPERAGEKLRHPPEFDLKVVLAEPDVVKPISAGWDPKGRLWLALTPQYPNRSDLWKTRPYDSIVWFEDRDGDGRFDRRVVFADDLDLVTSFVFHADGVIAMHAGEILRLRDTDGDGKADRREVLYAGFGYGDTHAVASNFRWGLDGWIYATQGYSGGASRNIRNAEGRTFGHVGNGIFRFRPDGSAIEIVSAYGSNTWGMDFSWDHEIFFTMANESHLRHVVLSEAALARGKVGKLESWKFIADHRDSNPPLPERTRPHPYVQIDCVGGFTAAAGSTLYDGGAWPDEYRQIHFVTECTINIVHQDRIEPDGLTYRATKVRAEEFVGGLDLWFRPIDTQIGPDGALYILDFYNQAVVHNDTRGPRHGPYNAAIRPDRDHLHGRVWRMQHKEARKLPAADFSSADGLVKALEHPNRWARLTAQRLICERGEGAAAVAGLLKSGNPTTRVIALWTLERLGKAAASAIVAALGDPDPGVRKNAARVAARQAKSEEVLRALAAGLEDADPRARLEKIVALGAFPLTPEAAAALLKVEAADPYTRSAVIGGLAASPVESALAALDRGDRALAEELAGAVALRQDAELAARLVVGIAGRTEATNPGKAAALVRLSRVLRPDLAPAPSADLEKSLLGLLASGDASVVAGALPFAARWGKEASLSKALEPVVETLLASLGDPKASAEARANNLASLLAIPSARARAVRASAKLLDPSSSADLQRAAIEALGGVADDSIAPALVSAWPRLAGASREAILAQLLKRPEWTAYLLREIEEKRFRPSDLGPSGIFRLKNHPDRPTGRKAAQVIDAATGLQSQAKDQVIAALLPVVEKAGDAAKGKALFADQCLKCHSYKGEGKSVSPDLTGMGVHGKRELLVHVVDPNRTVEGNYVSFNVKTKSGEVFNGIVSRETNESVTLKNNDGEREIRRGEIEAMVSTGLSLMPEGMESLGGEALRDILTYLTSEAGGFRVVDLQTAFTASTVRGLYDPVREPNNLRLRKFGIVTVEGIPFQLVDPSNSVRGQNAIVLKGGSAADWHCKTSLPQKVEFQVGFALEKLHVLGGIAAWGTLDPQKRPSPAVRVTWHYADGRTEEKVLRDAVEFSDWIRRVDVPGSKFAPGLVAEGQRGQVRWFTIAPARRDVAVHHVTLESYDNHLAPTFLAMTAEVGGAAPQEKGAAPARRTFMVGGGSSHDFEKWFKGADGGLLGGTWTSDVREIPAGLANADLLYLSTNQPIPDPAARKAIFDFVEAGRGLLLVHPACWYNWKDWPEYNRRLVGGGSRSHEKLQEFEVEVVDESHPVTAGVPRVFRVRDELYRFEKDAEGPEIRVLAKGKSLETGKEYPVVWTVAHPKGRIAAVTLGHDGASHEHAAYRALLKNAAAWLAPK
jgi:putative membrane-bound dehydrogenase-like protein